MFSFFKGKPTRLDYLREKIVKLDEKVTTLVDKTKKELDIVSTYEVPQYLKDCVKKEIEMLRLLIGTIRDFNERVKLVASDEDQYNIRALEKEFQGLCFRALEGLGNGKYYLRLIEAESEYRDHKIKLRCEKERSNIIN